MVLVDEKGDTIKDQQDAYCVHVPMNETVFEKDSW